MVKGGALPDCGLSRFLLCTFAACATRQKNICRTDVFHSAAKSGTEPHMSHDRKFHDIGRRTACIKTLSRQRSGSDQAYA